MTMEFEKRLRDRDRWSIGDGCSVAKVIDLLSTKTAFLVVRECFYGTTRFEDFVERIGTSAPAVSRALKQLESAGIIARVAVPGTGQAGPRRVPADRGGGGPAAGLPALMQWGDAHLQDGKGPLAFVDADSGRRVQVCVTADDGPVPARSEDIEIRYTGARRRQPLK